MFTFDSITPTHFQVPEIFHKLVSLHSVFDEMCADAVGRAARLFGVGVNLRDSKKCALCLLMARSCEKSVSNNSIWLRKFSYEVFSPSTLLLVGFLEKKAIIVRTYN